MMRIITIAIIATTMMIFSGCSTTAENPNYRQTTRYKSSNLYRDKAVVQRVNYQIQAPAPITYQTSYDQNHRKCISKESDNKTLGTVAGASIGSAAGYGIADKTINCDPVSHPVVVLQSAPAYQAVSQEVATYEAPISEQGIQENTASLGAGGTPGYYAVNGIEPPAQETFMATQPQYVQTPPLQQQQIQQPIPAAPTMLKSIPASAGTMRYQVIPGDTLYSLARTICSTVTEIQNLNRINNDFYIRAGEDILVPIGRCEK